MSNWAIWKDVKKDFDLFDWILAHIRKRPNAKRSPANSQTRAMATRERKTYIRARQLAAKCANNEIGYNLFSVSGGGPEQFTWNKNDNRSVVVKQSLFVGRWVFECVSACDCVWMWVCVWRGLGWKHPIPWNRAAIKFIVTLLYRIRCNAFPPHQICSEATGVHTVYECRTIEQSNNSSVIDIL